MRYVIGIDEAGRGPLAGPVAVGVVCVPVDFDWGLIEGVGDSKKLSPKKRSVLFWRAMELKKLGHLDFAVCQSSAAMIDRKGIVGAVNAAMQKALTSLKLDPEDCEVQLDGALCAPQRFTNQTTIIGGDGLEPTIGLASIIAKVTRDHYMARIGVKPQFAPYDLAIHKGYGTKAHREAIQKLGLSEIHRTTFCRNLLLQ